MFFSTIGEISSTSHAAGITMDLEFKLVLLCIISSFNIFDNISMGPVGLGGLGVPCSPRDPKFVGSNPAEDDGFFRT